MLSPDCVSYPRSWKFYLLNYFVVHSNNRNTKIRVAQMITDSKHDSDRDTEGDRDGSRIGILIGSCFCMRICYLWRYDGWLKKRSDLKGMYYALWKKVPYQESSRDSPVLLHMMRSSDRLIVLVVRSSSHIPGVG